MNRGISFVFRSAENWSAGVQECRSADECTSFRSVGGRSDAALRSVDDSAANLLNHQITNSLNKYQYCSRSQILRYPQDDRDGMNVMVQSLMFKVQPFQPNHQLTNSPTH